MTSDTIFDKIVPWTMMGMMGIVVAMFAGMILFGIGAVLTSVPNWFENMRCEWSGGEWHGFYGACMKAGPPEWYSDPS